MIHYSIGVRFALEISSYEAANMKAPFIEIDHVMLGILSLDKILPNLKNIAESDLDNFIYEKDKLYSKLIERHLNITSFRRKLRQLIPFSDGVPSDGIFHRSLECKRMFAYSSQFATNYVTINHLFTSIIGIEDSYSRNLLIAKKIDVEKLKTDLLFSFYKHN
jgi:chromosome condensin MukBEF ATPase and DNA-binding subunit MukB